jgi:hypothetical protein
MCKVTGMDLLEINCITPIYLNILLLFSFGFFGSSLMYEFVNREYDA